MRGHNLNHSNLCSCVSLYFFSFGLPDTSISSDGSSSMSPAWKLFAFNETTEMSNVHYWHQISFGLKGQTTQSWWRGALQAVKQGYYCVSGTICPVWKGKPSLKQHFSVSQHGSTGAASSTDTNQSCAVHGIAPTFSSHRIWPPNFLAQHPVILSALWFFQDNPGPLGNAPMFKGKHSQCCGFPSMITRRLNSSVVNKHDCFLKTHWCVCFQRVGEGRAEERRWGKRLKRKT